MNQIASSRNLILALLKLNIVNLWAESESFEGSCQTIPGMRRCRSPFSTIECKKVFDHDPEWCLDSKQAHPASHAHHMSTVTVKEPMAYGGYLDKQASGKEMGIF